MEPLTDGATIRSVVACPSSSASRSAACSCSRTGAWAARTRDATRSCCASSAAWPRRFRTRARRHPRAGPRAHRRPHGPRQQPLLPHAPRGGDREGADREGTDLRDGLHRSRPLQGEQRPLRPPGRQLDVAEGGAAARGRAPAAALLARYGGDEFVVICSAPTRGARPRPPSCCARPSLRRRLRPAPTATTRRRRYPVSRRRWASLLTAITSRPAATRSSPREYVPAPRRLRDT